MPTPGPAPAVRVRLRELTHDDAVALWNGRCPVPAVAGYPLPGSRGGAAVVLARDGAPAPGGLTAYLVVDAAGGLVVGDATFHAPPCEGVVEIGYGIAERERGRGLGTAAVAALVRLAWAAPDVVTVLATTETTNLASIVVLRRNGFRPSPADGDGWTRYVLTRDGQASPPVVPVVPAVTSESR